MWQKTIWLDVFEFDVINSMKTDINGYLNALAKIQCDKLF